MADEANPREPSDADLLTAVAAGDERAYGVLWSRHEGAARRLAAQLTRPSNVDDLVSESFLRVLRAVKDGGGPESAFRPYLFNTMRRYNIDTGRAYYQRVSLTGDEEILDVGSADAAGDVYADTEEQRAAWRAWDSLPDQSRTLLWHLIVEEETPAQIAPLLGVSPNGVASRAVRARERLRQAFLTQHLASADNERCRSVRTQLGSYVRDALSARDTAAVEVHLAECGRCAGAVAELRDVNGSLRLVIAPLLLGGSAVAARYLAASHHAAAALVASGAATGAASGAGGGSSGGGAVHVLGMLKTRWPVTAGVAAGAVCCAAGVAIAATSGGGAPTPRAADRHVSATPHVAAAPAVQQPPPAAPHPSPTPSHPPSHVTSPISLRTSSPTTPPATSNSATPKRHPHHSPPPANTPTATRPAGTPTSSTPARITRAVTVTLPATAWQTAAVELRTTGNWTIDNVTADAACVPLGSGSAQWQGVCLFDSQLSVTATGAPAVPGSLTATVQDASGTTSTDYPLP